MSESVVGTRRRIAVMQPYLFPYLGYFQLASSVDEFWLLDDVQFIRRGWMNRNRLLVDGRDHLFTVPVNAGPRNRPVLDVAFHPDTACVLARLVRTVRHAYANAPGRDDVTGILESLIAYLEDGPRLDFTTLTRYALEQVFHHVGITTPIRRVSTLALPTGVRGQDRILAVCAATGATDYLNMAGGRALYRAETFADEGVALQFLDPVMRPYGQPLEPFVAGLSILDVIARAERSSLPDLVAAGRIDGFS